MISKTFKIPIYRHRVTLIQTESFDEIIKKYNIVGVDEKTGGFHFIEDNRMSIVVSDKISHGDLAHECLHCINSIFYSIGYEPKTNNDEPQAYLLSWLIDKCYNYIKIK